MGSILSKIWAGMGLSFISHLLYSTPRTRPNTKRDIIPKTNEAAHYTPYEGDRKKFKTGDLVKVDLGAMVDG